MWLMLLVVTITGVMACLVLPEMRRPIGFAAAVLIVLLGLAMLADLARTFRELSEQKKARERIASSQIQLDDLQLTGTSRANYRLRGLLHNRSQTFTLTDLVFDVIVEDCVKGECREQARGHAEIVRRVAPSQSYGFDTDDVMLPALAPSRGDRRVTCRIVTTVGQP
jgi:hypothetical protein